MLTMLLSLILFAYLSAWLTRFIDHCMEPDMILHGYYKWLVKAAKVETHNNEVVYAKWFFYPLGGCIICMNFWVGVPVFLTFAYVYGFSWIMIILFWLFQAISFSFIKNGI